MSYLPSKANLRRQVAQLVSALGDHARAAADAAVCERVCALPEYRNARQVVAYSALADEATVTAVLERAEGEGKRAYLPAVVAGDALEFRLWRPGEPLTAGAFGVGEPPYGEAPANEPTLSLIPGRAFDVRGNRVGRGRGFYDRALSGLARLGPTVGVAYACQVFLSVPHEAHDVAVDLVISEEAVHRSRWPRDSRGEGGDGDA